MLNVLIKRLRKNDVFQESRNAWGRERW